MTVGTTAEGTAESAVPPRLLSATDVTVLAAPSTLSPGRRSDPPDHVWYASYGSNLLRERFRTYLVGGTPPGASHTHPPSQDPHEPGEEVALVVPGALGFAGDATSWGGGGVAFWHPEVPGWTLMRAWRLTLRQFLEVLHLENGGTAREQAPVAPSVWHDGDVDSGLGWYGRVVVTGEHLGLPVVTFTAPSRPSRGTRRTRGHRAEAPSPAALSPAPPDRPAPPGPTYARVVHRGLLETFGGPDRGGLTPAEAERYLAAAVTPGQSRPQPATGPQPADT